MTITKKDIPKYHEFFNPLLQAMHDLGGSASISEIEDKVAENLKFSDEMLEVPSSSSPSKSLVNYRLAWARSYLKDFGLLLNSQRGIWSLTSKAREYPTVDTVEVRRFSTQVGKERRERKKLSSPEEQEVEEDESPLEDSWEECLIDTIVDQVSAAGFERLIQRMLRESGFIQVEVTGRSGDGGIDGKGIAKIHGFMSFHILFQAKKYRGKVGSSAIRDFRGAMIGKGDKGLFITTGKFTKSAKEEASRDGATPIDLIDGELLAEKMKELGLGVTTTTIEKVEIDSDWFSEFKD